MAKGLFYKLHCQVVIAEDILETFLFFYSFCEESFMRWKNKAEF